MAGPDLISGLILLFYILWHWISWLAFGFDREKFYGIGFLGLPLGLIEKKMTKACSTF